MSNRSMNSTFRSIRCINGFYSRSRTPAARAFSTSPARNLSAIFTETENAELNKTLTEIQETIILPAYLPEKQRKLVFDPRKKTHLEQNPVIIEVEGLEHKFSTLDRFKGIKNSKKILNLAVDNMKDQDDWRNLATLLAGYRKAGIHLQDNHWGRVVRTAGEKGNVYAVIDCAKQASKTGLWLNNREVVVRILVYVNDKVARSGGELAETTQALKQMEVLLDLMQRSGHVARVRQTRERMHFSRIVRGLMLFARASYVKAKQASGEPVEKDLVLLKDDVQLFHSLWKGKESEDLAQAEEFAKLNPTLERQSSPKGVRIPKALNGSAYVQVLAQSIKAISLAREILGGEAEALAAVEVTLSSHLQQFVETAIGSTKGWAEEYEAVVGHAPKWQIKEKEDA